MSMLRNAMRPIICAAMPVIVTVPNSIDKKTLNKDHHLKNGSFTNPWESFIEQKITIGTALNVWKDWKSKPTPPVELLPQVVPVNWGIAETATAEERLSWSDTLRATWLGHACFFVEFPAQQSITGEPATRGARILFDPIFSQRCSPSQYIGPARVTQPPIDLHDLPHVDAVIISHNHYDHTDINTLKHIYATAEKGTTHFFTPLATKKWFLDAGFRAEDVTELDWWESRDLTLSLGAENQELTITATPCQHFSGRGITDRCATLWASWAVRQKAAVGLKSASVWFGGDTGYKSVPRGATTEEGLPTCPIFKTIGEEFGGFDLGLIPIGAYDPRWAMSRVHCNPEDAVELHCDVKARKSLGGHWGTFVLTCEDMTEPPKRLREAVKAKGLEEGTFDVCDIGETVAVVPHVF